MSLSREFLHERDQRIYTLRATGMSPTDIAKQLNITPSTVNNAVSRHIKKLNEGQPFNLIEVIMMELDRLDKMQSAIWPLTQHRRITVQNDDGTQHEITAPPDLRATEQVMKLMQLRAKILGYDINRTLNIETPEPVNVTSTLAGATQKDTHTAPSKEDETRQLVEIATQAGIFKEEVARALLSNNEPPEAEIVEEDD